MQRKSLGERFTDGAEWVSEFIGTPLNISFWVGAVVAWFLIFAIRPDLQYSNFLPSWFTSQAFNFPLNSITTLAELYIGFLCAAATNRAEKHLKGVLAQITEMSKQQAEMLAQIKQLVEQEEQELEALDK